MGAERREHARVATEEAVLCRAPATPRRVRLVDVSHGGCRIRALDGAAVPYGATVLLDFVRGRRISGQVVWVDAQSAGIRFEHRLAHDQAVVMGLEAPAETVTIARIEPEPVAPASGSLLAHWLRRLLARAA